MKRREIDGGVRFITFSCYQRLPLLSNPRIADLFADRLAWARREHRFELFAWVIMPEHAHLLLRPARGVPLEPALKSLKLAISMRVIRRWRRIAPAMVNRVTDANGEPHYWQPGGGFDRNVRNTTEFTREVRYIHRNPVERGLVASPELWRWSSVRWWMGLRDGELECDPPPDDGSDWSRWKGYI
jgi:putative transposase